MFITDLTQSQTQTLSLKQIRAEAKNWQVGNLLKAFVVSNTPKEGLTLNIQGQQYRVAPQQNLNNLQVGQRLNLEVMKNGDQPLLKVVQPQVQTREAIQNDGLRRNLPLQKPLGQLLNTLENLSKQVDSKQVNQQIRDISQRILNMLPDSSKVSTPDGLKQAVRDSGHFLENKLMQLATNPQADKQSLQQDIKTGLLRLLNVLKNNAPPSPPPVPLNNQQAVRPEPTVYSKNTLQNSAQQNLQTHNPQRPPSNPASSSTATLSSSQSQTQATARSINALNQPDAPTPGQAQSAGKSAPLPPQEANSPRTPQPQMPASNTATQVPQANVDTRGSSLQGQIEQMSNMVGDIKKDIEAGIARIQTNQINSVRSDGINDKPALHLELPIRNQQNQVNVMQLNIQRDREAGGPERPSIWSISLAFELVELGPIRAGMTLVGDKQISINIWAENETTVDIFDDKMSILREGLQNAGLVTGHVGIQQGAPSPKEVLGNAAESHQGLVDIEV